ncbi:glycosyltransferase [Saccharopolyspora shandongensis]|uniref:glycosyltransferase n=1 Tax=Saccharopolyspora shandongensis TaxID=418495 RepID=UPI00341F2966
MLTGAQAANLVEPEGLDLLATKSTMAEVLEDTLRATGVDMRTNPETRGATYIFAGSMVDLNANDALVLARGWKPDLVVYEISDHIGPLVAVALDVPAVMFGYGPRRPDEYTIAMEVVVASRYADRGLTPVPPIRYVDTCPPSVNYEDWQPPAERQLLRPEAYRQPWAETEVSLPAKGARPRVLVSFGTVFSNPRQLSPLLRALTEHDVEVVVTLGLAGKESEFDVDRERVRFSPFVPLDQLLTDVDVMVTHGGAGTTLAALAHGIPLVVLPQGADQPRQADRVANANVGIALIGDEATPEAVADAAIRCLTNPVIQARIARVRDEIAGMPSPDDVVKSLETLVG